MRVFLTVLLASVNVLAARNLLIAEEKLAGIGAALGGLGEATAGAIQGIGEATAGFIASIDQEDIDAGLALAAGGLELISSKLPEEEEEEEEPAVPQIIIIPGLKKAEEDPCACDVEILVALGKNILAPYFTVSEECDADSVIKVLDAEGEELYAIPKSECEEDRK